MEQKSNYSEFYVEHQGQNGQYRLANFPDSILAFVVPETVPFVLLRRGYKILQALNPAALKRPRTTIVVINAAATGINSVHMGITLHGRPTRINAVIQTRFRKDGAGRYQALSWR